MRSRREIIAAIAGHSRSIVATGIAGSNVSWVFYSDGMLYVKSDDSTARTWSSFSDWDSTNTPLVTDLKLENIDTVTAGGDRTKLTNCVNLYTDNKYKGQTNTNKSGLRFQNFYYDGTLAEWCGMDMQHINSFTSSNAYNLYIQGNLLENVIIPSNHLSYISGTFYRILSVKTAVIPEGETVVPSFSYCTNLESISIASTVSSIISLSGCSSLTELVLPNGLTTPPEIINCSSLHKITFGSGITRIPQGYSDSRTIGSSENPLIIKFLGDITSFGESAFRFGNGIETMEFRYCTSVPINYANFLSFNQLKGRIVVPDALYDDWIVATGWRKFASKTVKASEYVE